MKKRLVFDSNLDLIKPSQVIFYILERAAREGNFFMDDDHSSINLYVYDEIDEYIDRLQKTDLNMMIDGRPRPTPNKTKTYRKGL